MNSLKNQNGQAMAEAVVLSSFILTGSLFLIALFLNQIVSIAVDEAIETYFFCHIQKKENCITDLKQNLIQIRLNRINLTEKNNPPNYEISLTADTSLHYEIHRTRQMFFDRNIHFEQTPYQ